ncbi:hypothetical protein LJC60_04005, partial [Ruminococcaceae bacterium OttesenSCG-928-D13]|nr:hypothetical protein [Ruminococcaceae bacterium OttesenSCG-928-D13]
MTIRELITKYPDATLDLMTPGGYVYLTPEKAQALLSGEGTSGHPGDSRHAMNIFADEILSQNINSANYYKGDWRMLTVNSFSESQVAEQQIETGMRKLDIQARLFEKLDTEFTNMMS